MISRLMSVSPQDSRSARTLRLRRVALTAVLVVAGLNQSAQAQAQRIQGRFAPVLENVALITGPNGAMANGTLTDCVPETANSESCTLVVPKHVLEMISGETVTLTLAYGRTLPVVIREARSVNTVNKLETAVGPPGPLQLIVGRQTFTISFASNQPRTLESMRDVINGLASQTLVFADIVTSGDVAPQYSLRLRRSRTLESADLTIALRDGRRELVGEQALWRVPDKNLDLALLEISGVPVISIANRTLRPGLPDDAFADASALQQVEPGDTVRCIGFEPSQNGFHGFPGVRGGMIYGPLSEPTFFLDSFTVPGKSGAPCVTIPATQGAKPLIVGMIIAEIQYEDGRIMTIRTPANLAVLIKSSIVRDAVAAFKKLTRHSANQPSGI